MTAISGGFEILSTAKLADKLSLVASKGQIDQVQELLQSGAKFDTDQERRTALHYAALNGYSDICRLLIAHGCGLDHQDVVGFTALHRACSQGHAEICQVLLEAGCALDCQNEHGNTALHEAAWNGFSRTLEILIKFNCNVSIVNKSGFTALHLAAQNGHNESSRVLIYAGCSTDTKNNYGDTALHTAARYGHAGVTRIFISARCALNEQNKNGDSPLHIAAALKRRKITKLLVEAGIDPYIRNKQNETAVDVARRKEYPEIVHLIAAHAKRKSYCQPVVNVSMERPTVSFEGKKLPSNCETKPVKEKRFFFFKRKKKNKSVPNESQVTSHIPLQTVRGSERQTGKSQPVQGFFNKYVPKEGVQYYRDLAGNIKQGPIGYTPICQCIPVVKQLEKNLDETCENIYEHIDASHQMLQNRINQLDKRTAQQVFALDRLTNERFNVTRNQCQFQSEYREVEQPYTKYNDNVKSELQAYVTAQSSDDDDDDDDDGESYHPHHHDDSGFYHRSVFFKVYEHENGRLFRSRSDETLSQSDYSARHRKKDFYENRQAAMQHIRAWQTSDRNWRHEGYNYKDSQTKELNTGANRHRTVQASPVVTHLQHKDEQVPFLKSPSSDYVSYSDFKNPLPTNSRQGHQHIPHSWQPSYSSNAVDKSSSMQNSALVHKKSEKSRLVSPRIEYHCNTIPKATEKPSHLLEKDLAKTNSPTDTVLRPSTIYSSQNTIPRKCSDTAATLKIDSDCSQQILGISNYATAKPSLTQQAQSYKPSSPAHSSSLIKRDEGLGTSRSRSQDYLIDSPSKEMLQDSKLTNYTLEQQTVSLVHSKSHSNIRKDSISNNHSSLSTIYPKTSFISYSHPVSKIIPVSECSPTPCNKNHSSYTRYTPPTNTHTNSCTTESNQNAFARPVLTNSSKLYHRDDYQSISSQSANHIPPYKNPPPYHCTRNLQGNVDENFTDQKNQYKPKGNLDSQVKKDDLLTIKSGNTNNNFLGCVSPGSYATNNQVQQATTVRSAGAAGINLKKDSLLPQTSTEKMNEKFSTLSIEHVHQADISHSKEDSSSNPDSGYSSRIYGTTNLDASNQSSSTLLNSVHSSLTTPSSFCGTDQSFCASPTNLSPYRNQSEYSNSSAIDYENQMTSNKQYFESVAAHLQNWYHKKKQESLQKENFPQKNLVPGQQQQQQQKLHGTNVYLVGSTNQGGHNYIRGSDV